MRTYELIDRTDNDCHDEGDKALMEEYAAERNADEARVGGNPRRWTVKPAGFSATNFKG